VHRTPISPLPTETSRAAKSVFNIENVYLSVGDQLEDLFDDLNLETLGAFSGKPAATSFILAMVTMFQFAEEIPDRRATDALRTRMDWKYALHLPLDCATYAPEDLAEFRQSLLLDAAGLGVFRIMLNRLAKLGLVRTGDKPWHDVAAVVKAVDSFSRVERVTEAMALVLEVLASKQSAWLLTVSKPHWYERYDRDLAIRQLPLAREEQEALAQAIGADIFHLLQASSVADTPDIGRLPEMQALRRLWHREFDANNSRASHRDQNAY
jgi:transposase